LGAKVKALWAEDNLLKSFEIDIETYRGVIQPNGVVDSTELKGISQIGEMEGNDRL